MDWHTAPMLGKGQLYDFTCGITDARTALTQLCTAAIATAYR